MSEIRTLLPTDWKQYRDVRLRALLDSPDAFGSTYEDSIKYSDEAWEQRLANARPEMDLPMIAECEGKFVALAWAKIESSGSDTANLYQMWVDPDFRGKGIGRALLESAISWARARSVDRIILEVTCGDRPARRLYDAVGFEPVGLPKPLREGSDLLEQSMQLML